MAYRLLPCLAALGLIAAPAAAQDATSDSATLAATVEIIEPLTFTFTNEGAVELCPIQGGTSGSFTVRPGAGCSDVGGTIAFLSNDFELPEYEVTGPSGAQVGLSCSNTTGLDASGAEISIDVNDTDCTGLLFLGGGQATGALNLEVEVEPGTPDGFYVATIEVTAAVQ